MDRSIFATIALWWLANAIATISSKSVMIKEEASTWDLRWVELTALQQLVGAAVAAVWLKAVVRTSLHPANASKRVMFIATLGNVGGSLAINIAYAFISSSTVQVIKSCEPMFAMALTITLYKTQSAFDFRTILSALLMIIGAATFVLMDTSVNFVGIAAALTSSIAFPIHRVFMNKLSPAESWESNLQNYAVISLYSLLLLVPVLGVKVAIVRGLFSLTLQSLVSAVAYATYSIAAIAALHIVIPQTHSMLSVLKFLVVIVANIVYFYTPVSMSMSAGLLVLFIGLLLYNAPANTSKINNTWILRYVYTVSFVVICISMASFLNKERIEPILSKVDLYVVKHDVVEKSPKHMCPPSQHRISTAWVFDRPISEGLLSNFQDLSDTHACVPFHVYCGTSQCVDAVLKLNNPNITAEFLVVSTIVKGTPLEHWLAQHPINKVLAGVEFENHLHEVVRLGILWSRGGIYVDPTVRVRGSLVFTLPKCRNAWMGRNQVNNKPGLLDVSYFPKHHPFIGELVKHFVGEYPTFEKVREGVSFHLNFRKVIWKTYTAITESCHKPVLALQLRLKRLTASKQPLSDHYGTLSYRSYLQTCSLDDGMQGFPGLQFLPFIDRFIERDILALSAGSDNITTFFNGCWGVTGSSWPPPDNISPVMLSLHIDKSVQHLWAQEKSYLVKNAPIGCQDSSTLNFLKRHNIEAYFSGPLSLMTKNPNAGVKRTEDIYIINVERKVAHLLPLSVRSNAVTVRQDPEQDIHSLARYVAAYTLLETLGSAKLVITQCIHYALPCVAMGTPVIFINPNITTGEKVQTDNFTEAVELNSLFHTVDLHNTSMEDAKRWLYHFAWLNPPPNPNAGTAMRLKATAWSAISQHQALNDAAHKFGLFPLSPRTRSTDDQVVFHLVFTTAKSDNIELRGDSSGNIKGMFNWRHWRSLESVFFHHPFAKVIIHSNTLPQSEFNVLTEVGYSIEVRKYNLKELLVGSPAESFIENFDKLKEGHWYANEANLLRLLTLYNSGGVYMDPDVAIVRPVDSLPKNVIAWEDTHNESTNGAFMRFEKGNPFIKACLVEFADTFDGTKWGFNCPQLLTRVWRRSFENSTDVSVLDYTSFYMFFYDDVKEQCFQETSGPTFDSNVEILREKAYVVHLNSKMTGDEGIDSKLVEGTICKHLLNSFCILCNKQY